MFGKGATRRFDETRAMIGGAGLLTGPIRGQIVGLINAQFPRLTPGDRHALTQLSGDMSVKGQIPVRALRGHAPEREMRRAIFLLWMVIGKAQGIDIMIRPRAQQAMTMGVGQLAAAFSDVMFKAGVVAGTLGAQHVFQELEAHPVRFLTAHRIIILGTPAGGDRFSNAPDGNYQNVLPFHFQYDAGDDRFVLGTALNPQLGASHPFNTVSVPAVHWTQVPAAGAAPCNFGGVLGCELVGATFMLTTQFTGCAFSWTNHAGVVRASHVSPSGGGPGTYPGGGIALAQRMILNGAMANAGNTPSTVFGAGAGNAPVPAGNPFYPNPVAVPIRWVSIFGVVKGGGWRFYTQVIGNVLQILEARRIM